MIPATAQEIFDEVVRTRSIPWIPDDPEARELSWQQLVRENWVPAEHAGLINDLQRVLRRSRGALQTAALNIYARKHQLRYP